MSRSGYSDDLAIDSSWSYIRYRGAVESAIRGKRGQALLRELAAALDAMPVKELIANSAADDSGCVCTLGALAQAKGLDMAQFKVEDPEDEYEMEEKGNELVASVGFQNSLGREIMYFNDELGPHNQTPADRWHRMRRWIDHQLIEWEDEK